MHFTLFSAYSRGEVRSAGKTNKKENKHSQYLILFKKDLTVYIQQYILKYFMRFFLFFMFLVICTYK